MGMSKGMKEVIMHPLGWNPITWPVESLKKVSSRGSDSMGDVVSFLTLVIFYYITLLFLHLASNLALAAVGWSRWRWKMDVYRRKMKMDIVNRFWDYSSFIPSSMSFLLTVGFLKVGNQPITGNDMRRRRGWTPVIYFSTMGSSSPLWVVPEG